MSDSRHKAYNFLKQHSMGVVSTSDKDGKPWGSAVYYIVDEEFNVYFVTRAETNKYQNIKHNTGVSFTVADASTKTTIQLKGEVNEISASDYMNNLFDKFMKVRHQDNHNWSPPINKLHAGSFMPLRIKPTYLQYADYGRQSTDVDHNYIEQII